MAKWFILMKHVAHVHARHDQIISFSLHVNSVFGISDQPIGLVIFARGNVASIFLYLFKAKVLYR